MKQLMPKYCGYCKAVIKNPKSSEEIETVIAETCSAQCMRKLLAKMFSDGKLVVSPDGKITLAKN